MKKMMLVALTITAPAFAASLTVPCKLPFAALSAKQPIDGKCGLSGAPKNTPALAAQDTAKNNFCATGTPVSLTFDVYPGLQAAADQVLGGPDYKPPTTRTALHDLYAWKGKTIGEGMLVNLVGYVESAHYSDVSDGESVNCELTGEQNNDIHIPIVSTSGADECTSVTAEISPHFRPTAWTASNVNKPKVPMRFTGQLLFDAEHRPCQGTKADGPKRQSVWEVHPVYSIDVCVASDVTKCDGSDDKVWLALDQWLKQQPHTKN